MRTVCEVSKGVTRSVFKCLGSSHWESYDNCKTKPLYIIISIEKDTIAHEYIRKIDDDVQSLQSGNNHRVEATYYPMT